MVGGVVYWAKHQLFTCARRRGMPLVRSADGDHGSSTSPAIGLGSDFSEEPEYMLIPEVPNKPAGVSAGDVNTKVRRLTETVERLCHRGANQPLQKLLTKVHPADLATVLGGLPDHQVAQVFDAVANKQVAAQALVQVNPRVQELILSETPDFLKQWLQLRILHDCSQHQAAVMLGLTHRQAMQMDIHLRRYFQSWEKVQVTI